MLLGSSSARSHHCSYVQILQFDGTPHISFMVLCHFPWRKSRRDDTAETNEFCSESFPWDRVPFGLLHQALDHILIFIALCLLILRVSFTVAYVYFLLLLLSSLALF
jgi:hypothetical protein